MSRRPVIDVAASVRQRLLDIARANGRPFNEVLQYFAMERFLYRLGESPNGGKFVLKGALMLVAWRTPLSRATKDIDLLGRMKNNVEDVASAIRATCSQEVTPDGLLFDGKSVAALRIAEESDYQGVRVRFRGALGTARVTMQVDVGFGDLVVPGPVALDYPTLLDLPAPHLLGYSRESAIAEKFETMIKLGILNSRIRDFFDIWLLSRQFEFDGQTLAAAIRKTFAQRGTEFPAKPVALTEEFFEDPGKVSQWRGFTRKSLLHSSPKDLREVVLHLSRFLGPAGGIGPPVADGRPARGAGERGPAVAGSRPEQRGPQGPAARARAHRDEPDPPGPRGRSGSWDLSAIRRQPVSPASFSPPAAHQGWQRPGAGRAATSPGAWRLLFRSSAPCRNATMKIRQQVVEFQGSHTPSNFGSLFAEAPGRQSESGKFRNPRATRHGAQGGGPKWHHATI